MFFAFNPGQAITYLVGKLQILHFLADAKLDQGDDFSLREFHDFLRVNGNVPIALHRWEYLDRKDSVFRLDALSGQAATVPQYDCPVRASLARDHYESRARLALTGGEVQAMKKPSATCVTPGFRVWSG